MSILSTVLLPLTLGQGTVLNSPTASVIVDGDRLAGAAIVRNNRVLVEMRPVFERLGARVDYQGRDGSIRAFTQDRTIDLKIGQRMAMMPNETMLDSAPILRDSKVYVPLRAVSQAFRATVNWDRSSRTATVVTSPKTKRNGGAGESPTGYGGGANSNPQRS